MTLFDMMGEEEKQEYSIQLPDVGEYDKEQLLMFEKEVLGVYVSGHPLEAYEDMLRKNATHTSLDFALDEELGVSGVTDGTTAVIGGMVESRTIKYTKRNQPMGFFVLEDLVGSVEVVAFPKVYEKYSKVISEDAKLFVRGRVSAEDEKASKLIG
jgi:DNA polymerase-3 subunit alpha